MLITFCHHLFRAQYSPICRLQRSIAGVRAPVQEVEGVQPHHRRPGGAAGEKIARTIVYIGQGRHILIMHAAGTPQGAAGPPAPDSVDGGQDAERIWAELARD